MIRRADEPSRAFTVKTERCFVTEEGVEVLMFEPVTAPGSLDSVLGEDVYLGDERRTVKIVAERKNAEL